MSTPKSPLSVATQSRHSPIITHSTSLIFQIFSFLKAEFKSVVEIRCHFMTFVKACPRKAMTSGGEAIVLSINEPMLLQHADL